MEICVIRGRLRICGRKMSVFGKKSLRDVVHNTYYLYSFILLKEKKKEYDDVALNCGKQQEQDFTGRKRNAFSTRLYTIARNNFLLMHRHLQWLSTIILTWPCEENLWRGRRSGGGGKTMGKAVDNSRVVKTDRWGGGQVGSCPQVINRLPTKIVENCAH